MTRMTGPDCVVMCNLINTHTHIHIGKAVLDKTSGSNLLLPHCREWPPTIALSPDFLPELRLLLYPVPCTVLLSQVALPASQGPQSFVQL